MSIAEAIILGILQGLTEFLPVSSSGHLELASALFGMKDPDQNLTFSILLHGATVLSILAVFRKDILELAMAALRFKNSFETRYIGLLIASAVPVGITGLLMESHIRLFFGGRIILVGCMLIVTALLLYLTKFAQARQKDLNLPRALIIGLAQTIAIIPGISRSGATISTALMLGVSKEKATRFSFMMVLIPIIGASLLEIKDLLAGPVSLEGSALLPMAAGFLAAFLSGLFACRWMLALVRRGRMHYFAFYCLGAGALAILIGVL